MSRGIFEDVGSLSTVGIYNINFAYDTNMTVYTTLSSDIPMSGEILLSQFKKARLIC
jgi:hypothetical protein